MEAIIIGFVIAAVVAGFVLAAMYKQMKPVAQKLEAAQYTSQKDVKITVSKDRFLRTETKRRPISQKT